MRFGGIKKNPYPLRESYSNMKLPFKDPDYDLGLNMGIMLIIISLLSKTKRGKSVLNNDRLHIYLCLAKNPSILSRVISSSGGGNVNLEEIHSYSIATIAPSLDSLFDDEILKSLLMALISKDLVGVTYRKNEGFFYSSTEAGNQLSGKLGEDYFCEIKRFCSMMTGLQTKSVSQINIFLNQYLRMD